MNNYETLDRSWIIGIAITPYILCTVFEFIINTLNC